MEVFRRNISSMGNMIKGKEKFDTVVFTWSARDLAAAAKLDVPEGFPEDFINDESYADDSIWHEVERP